MNNFKLLVSGACLAFVMLGGSACQQPSVTLNSPPTSNAGNPAQAAAPGQNPPAQSPPAQNPEDAMPRIKVEEAKALVEKGSAVILDVRGSDAYKTSHVKGALDYPLSRLEQSDFKDLPKNKRIIAYCS